MADNLIFHKVEPTKEEKEDEFDDDFKDDETLSTQVSDEKPCSQVKTNLIPYDDEDFEPNFSQQSSSATIEVLDDKQPKVFPEAEEVTTVNDPDVIDLEALD